MVAEFSKRVHSEDFTRPASLREMPAWDDKTSAFWLPSSVFGVQTPAFFRKTSAFSLKTSAFFLCASVFFRKTSASGDKTSAFFHQTRAFDAKTSTSHARFEKLRPVSTFSRKRITG